MFIRALSDLYGHSRSLVLAMLMASVASAALPDVAHGHAGEDHGPPASALPSSALPRATATGELFEIVAVAMGGELVMFVDRLADNAPVTMAELNVTIGTTEFAARAETDGTYRVTAPELGQPGRHDLIVTIQDAGSTDLTIATLEIPDAAKAAPSLPPKPGAIATAAHWLTPIEPFIRSAAAEVIDLAPASIAAPARSWIATKQAPLFLAIGAGLVLILSSFALLPRTRRSAAKAALPPGTAAPAALAIEVPKSVAIGTMIGLLVLLPWTEPADAATKAKSKTVTLPPAVITPQPAVVTPPPARMAIAVTGDAPRRLADGTVFLPKPTQRLLEVRTITAKAEPSRPSQALVGRIIANPNRSGLVQSSTGGRLTPPPNGLPSLGQAVKANEVLAFVTPALQAIDSSDLTQAAGELDQEIDLARSRLKRAKLLFEQSAGTRVKVEEAELLLQGLERRRSALKINPVRAERLTAPVDGVISVARAVLGQVVAPQDVLFEVIDTRSLWVEAFVFEFSSSRQLTQPVAAAQDGSSVPLTFIGRSRSLRQQSAILHFEMTDPPASMDVGMPVTVYAQAGEPVIGFVLPKAAVVRSSSGEDVVWRHVEPERFAAQPVKIKPFDGSRVLVEAGLTEGQRIVIQSAELINQVR